MNQNRMPLIEVLQKHIHKQSISFHVPGHKNGLLFTDERLAAFGAFDVTELTGLDDLHEPEEAIAQAEALLTDLYQTKKSYFLVNGSTVGNLAMILATCKQGDQVLVQRNCHKSIVHALMLAKVQPIFITPSQTNQAIEPDYVAAAFKQYPQIKACIFTYPDYYGRIYDLPTIIEIIHAHQAIVLIDEAHGAHFSLAAPIPDSALALGADIVVHSAHKMLPAMTMGSYLHINSDRVSVKRIEQYLTILQSSSPSYPIMASLDYARHYLAHITNEDLHYTLSCRQQFMQQIKQKTELQIVPSTEGQDPLKLMLFHPHISGFQLQSKLEEVAIYPELADPNVVLLTLPLLKVGMEFPYEQAVEKMSHLEFKANHRSSLIDGNIPIERITKLMFTYDEMNEMETEAVYIDDAEGRVAAQMLIPYPPGIPLLLTGEKITEHHVKTLRYLIANHARFQGGDPLIDGKVIVFTL